MKKITKVIGIALLLFLVVGSLYAQNSVTKDGWREGTDKINITSPRRISSSSITSVGMDVNLALVSAANSPGSRVFTMVNRLPGVYFAGYYQYRKHRCKKSQHLLFDQVFLSTVQTHKFFCYLQL